MKFKTVHELNPLNSSIVACQSEREAKLQQVSQRLAHHAFGRDVATKLRKRCLVSLDETSKEFALTSEAQRSLVLRLLHACTVLV
jgi:hypothetical protein